MTVISIVRVVIAGLICFAIGSGTAVSQTIEPTTVRFVAPKSNGTARDNIKDYGYVELTGGIQRSAVPQLLAALVQAKRASLRRTLGDDPIVLVLLNSKGGEVAAAMEMGRLLRTQAADAWVDSRAECSSSRILLLAGGVSRWVIPGAKLGLHRPYFPPSEFAGLPYAESQRKYGVLASAVKAYLAEMGVGESLFDAMMQVPSKSVRYIDMKFAEESKLLGTDPAYDEWQRARSLRSLGPARLEMLERYTDCINAGKPERTCSTILSNW